MHFGELFQLVSPLDPTQYLYKASPKNTGCRSRRRCSSLQSQIKKWVLNESNTYKRKPKKNFSLTCHFLETAFFLKKFRNLCFSFGQCSFHKEWHVRLKFVLIFFYRHISYLVPKASSAITYFGCSWATLTPTPTTGVLECSFVRKYPFDLKTQQLFQIGPKMADLFICWLILPQKIRFTRPKFQILTNWIHVWLSGSNNSFAS
jgi:hypothetical protein